MFNLGLERERNEEIEAALKRIIKKTETKTELLISLVNTAYNVQENQTINKADLAVFEEGISQSWEDIWYSYSGRFVATLSNYFREAEDLLIKMSKSKSSQVRQHINSIISERKYAPSKRVFDSVIMNGINDKSKYIRSSTAWTIFQFDRYDMQYILEERLGIESDDYAKDCIIESLNLMTKGHNIKKFDDGFLLRVKISNRKLKNIFLKEDELDKYRNENIISAISEGVYNENCISFTEFI